MVSQRVKHVARPNISFCIGKRTEGMRKGDSFNFQQVINPEKRPNIQGKSELTCSQGRGPIKELGIVSELKSCADQRDISKGTQLHSDILKRGIPKMSTTVGNNLINMYAKCGDLASAKQVFIQLSVRDVVSWNVLLSGFCEHDRGEDVLYYVECMEGEGILPNKVTYLCTFKACGSIGATQMGKVAHAEVARRGLLGNDIVLGNALVDMYAKCGAFYEAKELLYVLPVQNVVSWTALISGYAKHGQGRQALDCFTEMQHNGLSPNPITFPCILKACGSTKEIVKGEVVHAKILELGLLRDAAIGNALVDMYAKFGQLLNAQQVFDILPNQNLVSWNTLLAGYSLHGHGERVLTLYQKMRLKGIFGDDASFSCVLSACGSARNLGMGREIHDELVKRGLLKRSCILGNALLDMYAKCGALTEAQVIFDELVVQDVISWTALIVGYYQHGLGVAALHCFDQMKHEGFTPDAVTFTCILKACGSVGALEKGKEIHSEVISGGCLEETAVIGNGLVEMYTRCGALQKAQKVFDELPVHDVNTWNALMAGYAQVGMHEIVFDYFNKLLEDGIRPNFETFFILLSVCSGSGLVDEGQMYYNAMGSNFNISPTLEHCNCMVYLLGLSGQFNEAVQMIKKLPASCDSSLWYGLLSACQPWGYEKFAGFAFDNAIMVNRKDLTMVH